MTVDSSALDEPVITAMACDALLNTGLAKIKVAVFAGGAMVVYSRRGLVATIAADSELGTLCSRAGCRRRPSKVLWRRVAV